MNPLLRRAAFFGLFVFASVLRGETVVEAWVQRYNSNAADEGRAVAVDAAGYTLVTGTITAANGQFDCYTAKYAPADGAVVWSKIYNGPANNNDEGRAVALDASGNVIITATSVGTAGNYDYYTAKYAAIDGALLWEKRYNGPGNNTDEPTAVAVDPSGHVAVTGFSTGAGGNYDYYTVKYRAADGVQLWEARANGTGNGFDWAWGVATDSAGNVVVTGSSPSPGNNFDILTVKYAAANGAVVWFKRYNGQFNNRDDGFAVAVDSGNNVIVTGGSAGPSGSTDCYTVKYAGTNGNVLWEQRYNGSLSSTDEAYAVAVDPSGNVCIAGYTSSAPFNNQDYYVAKYAAANGALLWEKIYDGPVSGFDRARSIVADASGNVIASGYSSGAADDYYTVKYAASNGAVLWQARYDGPAHNYDTHVGAKLLAAGPGGSYSVTGISSNGNNTDIATIRYRPATACDEWKLVHLGDANAPDLDDPDQDGLTTLFEYGTGTLPHLGNAPALEAAAFAYPDGARLRLFLTRDPGRDDIIVTVDASSSPAGPWSALASSAAGAPFVGPGYVSGDDSTPGIKNVEIRDTHTISAANRRFVRVTVTRS